MNVDLGFKDTNKVFCDFIDKICVLQDCFTKTLIGISEERDGVYYLIDVVTAKAHRVDVFSDQALGNQCLEHPCFFGFCDFTYVFYLIILC